MAAGCWPRLLGDSCMLLAAMDVGVWPMTCGFCMFLSTTMLRSPSCSAVSIVRLALLRDPATCFHARTKHGKSSLPTVRFLARGLCLN